MARYDFFDPQPFASQEGGLFGGYPWPTPEASSVSEPDLVQDALRAGAIKIQGRGARVPIAPFDYYWSPVDHPPAGEPAPPAPEWLGQAAGFPLTPGGEALPKHDLPKPDLPQPALRDVSEHKDPWNEFWEHSMWLSPLRHLVEGVGVTGDVLSGRLNPYSDEGIRKAMGIAMHETPFAPGVELPRLGEEILKTGAGGLLDWLADRNDNATTPQIPLANFVVPRTSAAPPSEADLAQDALQAAAERLGRRGGRGFEARWSPLEAPRPAAPQPAWLVNGARFPTQNPYAGSGDDVFPPPPGTLRA